MKIELAKTEIIHFVGIGGIGMSGLSLIMRGKGFKVQGSDLNYNKNIDRLKKEKIKIFIGHRKQNLKNATIVVVSSAIKKNNPEIIEAKRKNLPVITRGKMLAHIVSLTKNIVVAGSHGKTTTTSLVTSIFQKTKLDPSIINGGVINSLNNTAKLGKSDWSILEADESDGSFLKLPINYSIVTNIDYEHIDYYKNFKNLENSFMKFIEKTPPTGKSIVCVDDKNVKKILKKIKNKNILTYGENKKANYRISNIKYRIDYSSFEGKSKKIVDSLVQTFKTNNGRKVVDSRGIEPEIKIEPEYFSAVTELLLSESIIFEFINNNIYKHKNDSLYPSSFSIQESFYNEFVDFVLKKELKYQTASQFHLEELKEVATKEKYLNENKRLFSIMDSVFKTNVLQDLTKHKKEIKFLLESEIISRKHFHKGRVEASLKQDPHILKAEKLFKDKESYYEILGF